MAEILDGRALARTIRKEIKEQVAALTEAHGVVPRLDVIRIGEDPASASYVRSKLRTTERLGMRAVEHHLDPAVQREALAALIDRLNADDDVDGILLQLPIPEHLDADALLDRIDPLKDVDGFHPENMGRLLLGRKSVFAPCTPLAIMEILERSGVELEGKDAVVLGRSNIVGKPVALMLQAKNATVTVCHSRTREIEARVRRADIVVAAIGRAKMIPGAWLKPGAVVIDVGINRIEDGRLVGDVDFESASQLAGAITPVPGGVGPMTVTMVVHQTYRAALLRRHLEF